MDRWVGRVAIVTGASAGIGASISEELVKKGLKVVGLARRVEMIQELSKTLEAEKGKLYGIKCDITEVSEVKKAFEWIKFNLGSVDVLVNNAGANFANTLIDGPVENWKHILDLNVLALSICTKEAFQCMKDCGVEEGHIFHINSILGHRIVPAVEFGVSMYSASKYAVTALTEAFRRELVHRNSKIRITSLSPGLVKTDFITTSGTKAVSQEEVHSNNSFLLPKDVADCVVFALSLPQNVQVSELTIQPVGERY